jgi:hypothetical protein
VVQIVSQFDKARHIVRRTLLTDQEEIGEGPGLEGWYCVVCTYGALLSSNAVTEVQGLFQFRMQSNIRC